VNSQVFDHTSVGQFLEKRFGVVVPAISPWHRAVCGDLTSVFDFEHPNEAPFPELPPVGNSTAVIAAVTKLPAPAPPATRENLFQEPGMRRSRPLPYELHVDAHIQHPGYTLTLTFRNTGKAGAVFHVYNRLRLDQIPRRYTVEVGKRLSEHWLPNKDDGRYDLWVYGPNGFVREFRGVLRKDARTSPEIEIKYDVANGAIELTATNGGHDEAMLEVRANAYRREGPWHLHVLRGRPVSQQWPVLASHNWYDFTVAAEGFERRFAGRIENGKGSFSDPAV
jgi:phospholipase C